MKKHKSLCWNCDRATGFCPWSREFEPVQGWVANKTIVHQSRKINFESYDVIYCPLFEPDPRSVSRCFSCGKKITKGTIMCPHCKTAFLDNIELRKDWNLYISDNDLKLYEAFIKEREQV